MLYISENSTDPHWNLAAEEYLLKEFSEPLFRLWQNSNSIIIGQYQNAFAEIDFDYVKAQQISVVRRLTGGGAVFHDMGNLNFSFIEPYTIKEETNSMFRRFTAPVVEAINSLGVKAYIEGRNDLLIDGRKFSGNAMCINSGRVLQHGTLLFSSSMNNLSKALKSRPEKFIGKSVKSNVSRVTNISEHLPIKMDVIQFKEYIEDFLCNRYRNGGEGENIIKYNYTENDIRAINALVESKYGQDHWNFGNSPKYNTHNTRKFPGGLLEFSFVVNRGKITGLEIFGDYFFSRPTSEFIEKLLSEPLLHTEREIRERISALNHKDYFHNITEAELVSMFF